MKREIETLPARPPKEELTHKRACPTVLFFVYCPLEETKQFVRNIAVGATMPSINTKLLGEVEIALPDLNNQKRIAAVLSSLDDKIENNQKLNDNLEQQAQAIYHERFETVSPNDLPSEWRIVTLGEVATISNKSFNPLKEPEILLEHYSIPAFDEARFPVFELSTSIKSNKFIIDASCFMISKLNPTTKRVWKPYCLTGNAVCSTEFIVYKAKDKTITDFLYSVIDSNSFSDFMCSHVTGSNRNNNIGTENQPVQLGGLVSNVPRTSIRRVIYQHRNSGQQTQLG